MKKRLRDEMKLALKAKDQVRLDTIRALLSEIQYAEMQKDVEDIANEEILPIFQREIKKRKEELEFAEKSGRADLKTKTFAEIAAIESFLPKQLSRDELKNIISAAKSAAPSLNMGAAMKILRDTYAGQFDGKIASEVAKELLG
jgi:uncharacterized protein YqeY